MSFAGLPSVTLSGSPANAKRAELVDVFEWKALKG
jgi:hypothetical protein